MRTQPLDLAVGLKETDCRNTREVNKLGSHLIWIENGGGGWKLNHDSET